MSTANPFTASERRMATFRVEALSRTLGRLRVEVDNAPIAVLEIRDGVVQLKPDDGGRVDGVITCTAEDEPSVWRMLMGEFNPIVGLLRARYQVKQNPEFVAAVLLALQRKPAPGDRGQEV